jgi:hypothetical protein
MAAVAAAGVASYIDRANNTSTSPDRVITCTILTEHVPQDEDDSSWWTTDRCGVLLPPESLISMLNGDHRHAIRDLDPGHTYRIRVHDVQVEGPPDEQRRMSSIDTPRRRGWACPAGSPDAVVEAGVFQLQAGSDPRSVQHRARGLTGSQRSPPPAPVDHLHRL